MAGMAGMASAAPPVLTLDEAGEAPVGRHLAVLQESVTGMGPVQALNAFRRGEGQQGDAVTISRGIGSPPLWLAVTVTNPADRPVRRRLSVEIGWLDRVELYSVRENRLRAHGVAGDRVPVLERAEPYRFPRFELRLPPGQTVLLLRVATADPMVVPVYLSDVNTAAARDRGRTAFHGLVYGVVLGLSAYNFMLFLGLRQRRYGLYTLSLTVFVAMNIAYTGIGMQYLWPTATGWQQWAPPTLILLFAFSGLAFAICFLGTRQSQPPLFRLIQWLCGLFAALMAVLALVGQQSAGLLAAFAFVPVYTLLMVWLGVSAWRLGNGSARYFLLGTFASALGASVTAFSVWGVLPFTLAGFYAVDVGMAVDAVLLALALAHQVRLSETARQTAERDAHSDTLTGLPNRRGLQAVAQSLWRWAGDDGLPVSVLVVDVDRFKPVNDRYGHAFGDRVLQSVADRLTREKRRGDLLARWGGEEFVLLLPDTAPEDAVEVAERCRRSVAAQPIGGGSVAVAITVSIGVAGSPAWRGTLEELIAMADTLLYRAKAGGRNRVADHSDGRRETAAGRRNPVAGAAPEQDGA